MKSRRNALSTLTGGVAALAFGGGLLRPTPVHSQTVSQDRGYLIEFPETGFEIVRANRTPFFVTRVTSNMRILIEETPVGPNPFLNRDGVDTDSIEATVDTVLQGPDQDLLILSMLLHGLDGIILYAGQGRLGSSTAFIDPGTQARFDGLGRIQFGGLGEPRITNLFSPTLHETEEGFFIKPANFRADQP